MTAIQYLVCFSSVQPAAIANERARGPESSIRAAEVQFHADDDGEAVASAPYSPEFAGAQNSRRGSCSSRRGRTLFFDRCCFESRRGEYLR